jgi:ribosomal protein L40E
VTIYICSECGKEIPQESDFCYHCGSLRSKAYTLEYKAGQPPEERACPECGIENEPDIKFCRHCGVEMDAVKAQNVVRPRPAGPFAGNGYGYANQQVPVLQKGGGAAMLLSIIFGFLGIYGIGHLIMKRWSRGLMFLAMSSVNWYIYLSVGFPPTFVMLISLMLFFKQSMEITNIAYGRL